MDVTGLKQQRRHLAGAILLGALTLTGCGTEGAAESPPKQTLTPPVVTPEKPPISGYAAMLKSPLAAYDMTDKQADAMWTALRSMRTSCVRAKGFQQYDGQDMLPVGSSRSSDEAIKRPAGPWGYLGAETAATRGFLSGPVRTASNQKVDLPADELAASRACFEESSAKLSPPVEGADLVRQIAAEATGYAERDTRVVTARKQWATCMEQSGFTGADPRELASKQWRRPTDPATADEISAAIADEKCTVSSGLAAIYFPVERGYQQQLIDRNIQVLTEHQTQLRSRIAEAARIVATGDAS
jgi:hypothetical protein